MTPFDITIKALCDQGFYEVPGQYHPRDYKSHFMCYAIENAIMTMEDPESEPELGEAFDMPTYGMPLRETYGEIQKYLGELLSVYCSNGGARGSSPNTGSSIGGLFMSIVLKRGDKFGRYHQELHKLHLDSNDLSWPIYQDWENRPRTRNEVLALFTKLGLPHSLPDDDGE